MTQSMPTTGRWGWYRDHEGAERRRVSTLVKKVETDSHSLDLWKQRQVLIGAARRNDLITAIKAMGDPDPLTGWTREQKRLQNELTEKAAEAAKDTDGAVTGTAVHTLTERVDRGESIDSVAAGLPALLGETVRAYATLRRLNGWRSVEIERTVECEELEVRGSLDRVDLVPGLAAMLGPGECQHGHAAAGLSHDPSGANDADELPVIVDVKTEEKPWLNGLHIGPQLAIYSRAKRMWNRLPGEHPAGRWPSGDVRMDPNGEYVPAPCVRQDVAIVVHLRDGVATPIFVDLTEGWQAAVAAYEQTKREARAKRAMGAKGAWFAPVPNVIRPKVAQTLVEHAAAEGYADPSRPAAVAAQAPLPDLSAYRARMPTASSTVIGVTVWDAAKGNPSAVPVGPPSLGVDGPTTIATAQQMSDGTTHYAVSPSGADIVGGHGPMPGVAEAGRQFDQHDELRIKLIEQIWQARTVDGLAILWNMARDRSVPWTGPVAQAADARRRQIECPQRAMAHVPGTVKCACAWTPAVPA